ncbi:small secreted protein [Streptomyces sp. NBC_00249]|uniref:small secreted protein n=1 Tax=Streptomyces sp. NBC_00249 TaxID=2975690 RepID=UPI002252E9C3|nr:small secreted protein [Streptomyces sp. NBC_00249]MCX5195933.1 small secreted protein [Streptomyces sp. NBC_00249]
MNKKLAAAVSGGAVLMLVLSGCGGDGDDGAKKADAWAKKVCDKWEPELTKIKDTNDELKRVATQSSKPEEVQKTDSAAFQTLSEAYKSMGGALTAAGEPPVADGKTAAAAVVKSYDEISKGYVDLKTKIDALDAKDQAKFAEGLQQVAGGLTEVAANETASKQKLNSTGLKVIYNQQGCKVSTDVQPSSG